MDKEIKEEKIEKGVDKEMDRDTEIVGKKISDKENKQIMWALFLMISLIFIIIAVPYINSNFINKFDYKGLEFQKTRLGNLVFYSARFPVLGVTGQVLGNYAVNFRNDPRKLEDIKVNVTNDTIKFALDGKKFGTVYISLNPYMEKCEDSVISMAGLSKFLVDSSLTVKSAYTVKSYAEKNNWTHRWCDSSSFDTVIVVSNESENSITEIGESCYKISFKDCEILKTTEKFELFILEEYASRFNDQ